MIEAAKNCIESRLESTDLEALVNELLSATNAEELFASASKVAVFAADHVTLEQLGHDCQAAECNNIFPVVLTKLSNVQLQKHAWFSLSVKDDPQHYAR